MESVADNGRLLLAEETLARDGPSNGATGLLTMPEEEVEEAEGSEEESEETIEELFKGESEGDGEGADVAEPDGEVGSENVDEEEPDEVEEAEDGAGADEDAEEFDDEEAGDYDDEVEGEDEDAGETEGDEESTDDEEDDRGEVLDDSAGASDIEEGLLAVDDPSEPPERVAGGADGGRLTTGIEALDHHLGGGIPPGRIVSFVATADTQSELLVKQLASQHDCLYLSTLRPKWEVQEDVTDYIQKQGFTSADQRVQIEQLTADSRLDAARQYVEELDSRSVVVIDSANELESSDKHRYAYFIDEVKRALWDTGSVGLFYCIEEERPPSGRAVTLRRADVIWRLRRSEDVGGIRHELMISKFRGGRALIEPLTLWLTDEVLMDDGSNAQ